MWPDDERPFSKLVAYLEKAEFRLLVSGAHQSTVADSYFQAALRVRRGDNADAIIARLKATVRSLAPDSAFSAGLNSMRYGYRRARIRHLLALADDYREDYLNMVRGRTTTVEPNKIRAWNLDVADVDHIYPQSGTSRDMHDVKNQLGNLTLLLDKHNRVRARALLPTNKKKLGIYSACGIPMTKALVSQIKKFGWDANEVAKRQLDLVMAEYIYRV
jgi:hypothetical protein